MSELNICQSIVTIQGEGKFAGYPSILIRFSNCNLKCSFCDTKYSWVTKSKKTNNITNLNDFDNLINKLNKNKNIKRLMITGGEPLIYNNNEIFLKILKKYIIDKKWDVEIETNGSLLYNINQEFLSIFEDKYNAILNISPKFNKEFYKSLDDYQNLEKGILKILYSNEINIQFKFVYDPEEESYQMNEFIKRILQYDDRIPIRLMPCTPNREDYKNHDTFLKKLNECSLKTVEYCIKNNYIFVPRLHLHLFKTENELI